MQDFVILSSDQLQKYFDDMVQKVEFIIKNSQKREIASKELLTAKEVCTLLKISHTTLPDWSSKGVIQKHHVGVNRIRFRHDEIMDSLERMEVKKRRV